MSHLHEVIGNGRECTTELLAKFGSLPLLTHQEEIEYGLQVKQGEERARCKLVEHNVRLVIKIAAKFTGYGLEMDDLVNEGMIGLITAINKFEPDKGNRFSTYATYWIRQAVQRAAASKSTLMRIPIQVHDLKYKINKVADAFIADFNREPSPEELALLTDIPLIKVRACLAYCRGVSSLDEEVSEDGDTTLSQLIAIQQINPEDRTTSDIQSVELIKILGTLQQREQYVIKSRYGLAGYEPRSLEQIGRDLGVTRERVRQIEKRAIKMLLKHPKFISLVA